MSFDYKRLVKFEHNVGAKDKKVRMTAGIILLAVSLFTAKILLLVVGLVLVGTSYFGWCPAYSGFDKNTLESEGGADEAVSSDAQADADSDSDGQ
ncbi:MAG: YgaP family membrane protein [Gammaproteobacteria bacterium]